MWTTCVQLQPVLLRLESSLPEGRAMGFTGICVRGVSNAVIPSVSRLGGRDAFVLPPRGSPRTETLGPCSKRRNNSYVAYRCSVRRTASGAWRVAGCEDGPGEMRVETV